MSASAHGDAGTRTASDGVELAATRWPAEGATKAQLLLVHGLGEHLGRYQEFGQLLAAAGCTVAGVDLRGFGRSAGKRGHVRQWSHYTFDLDAALGLLEPGPLVVLAHSMGGLVTLDWLQRSARARDVVGLILSGPLVGNAIQPPRWKHEMAKVLDKVWPSLALPNGIPLQELSTVETEVRLFHDDPLRVGTVTPRWYLGMLHTLERAWSYIPHAELPLQLHIAGEEHIIDCDSLERLAREWDGPCEVRRWPGARHEIMHEPVAAEVAAAMAEAAIAFTAAAQSSSSTSSESTA